MKNLYIFLDFDGVLNSGNDGYGRNHESGLNMELVNSFCDMVDEISKTLSVKVIISSAWKMYRTKETFIKQLSKYKDLERFIKLIYDITPTSFSSTDMVRGFEIELYIHNNCNFYRYDLKDYVFITIDDGKVETPHMPFVKHFRTNISRGLMSYDIEKIKKYLKEEVEKDEKDTRG